MDQNSQMEELPSQISKQSFPVSDEIDFLDIWRVLIGQKWLIMWITILFTAVAVGAALLLPKVYQAKVIVMPPLSKTVEQLNVPNVQESFGPYFFKITPTELYADFIENVQSVDLQRQFFDEHDLVHSLSKENDTRNVEEIFLKKFSEKITVSEIKNRKEFGTVAILLDGASAVHVADWLNNYVKFVDSITISSTTQAFMEKKQRINNSLVQRIENLRFMEKSRRLDLIAQLEEGVYVAKKLGWIERPENPEILYEKAESGYRNMSFSLQEMPLYMRGAKALQAEIDVLKLRKNDDPFIPSLRHLQAQVDLLEIVQQDTENVHSMRLDLKSFPSDKPVKPKRRLMVILGLFAGLAFGVLAAFIRNMIVAAK